MPACFVLIGGWTPYIQLVATQQINSFANVAQGFHVMSGNTMNNTSGNLLHRLFSRSYVFDGHSWSQDTVDWLLVVVNDAHTPAAEKDAASKLLKAHEEWQTRRHQQSKHVRRGLLSVASLSIALLSAYLFKSNYSKVQKSLASN